MKVWCLFEQSGTFKNAFKELGYEAYDVDILNDFQQTDYVVDIFAHIKAEVAILDLNTQSENTIFSDIDKDDLVFAFFPCTRFTEKHYLNTRCENFFFKNWDDLKRLEYTQKMISETYNNYITLCRLFEIAFKKGFKMVVENPDANQHFLKSFFPFKPAVTIKDRSKYGDIYKKPTNFWFVNFKPSFNFIFENVEKKPVPVINKKEIGFSGVQSKKAKEAQVERSLISPEFARNFIKSFVLGEGVEVA